MDIASVLRQLPILNKFSSAELAALVPSVEVRELDTQEILFSQAEQCHAVFAVLHGEVELTRGQDRVNQVQQGFIGQEAVLGDRSYRMNAIATIETRVLVIKVQALKELLGKSYRAFTEFHRSQLQQLAPLEDTEIREEGNWQVTTTNWVVILGWLLAIVVPPSIFWLLNKQLNIGWAVSNFVSCIMAMTVLLAFQLTPLFVPLLFFLLAMVILGIAPSEVIFSGFGSGTFYIALSMFVLAVVIRKSGIFYRLALVGIKKIPKNIRLFEIFGYGFGILITPLIATGSGRAGICIPLIKDMIKGLGYKPGGKAATSLSYAIMRGISSFGGCFLTGGATNFILLGLLPEASQQQFGWVTWFKGSFVCMSIMMLIYFIMLLIYFRHDEKITISDKVLNNQLAVLGRVDASEWVAIASVVTLILGLITGSWHEISPPWIALSLVFVFVSVGIITEKEFRHEVNWSFLFAIGGFIGIARVGEHLQLQELLVLHMGWVEALVHNPYLFFSTIFFALIILGFVVDGLVAAVAICAVCIPLAVSHHIEPWLIIFVVLMAYEVWFFPFESSGYLMLQANAGKRPFYNKRQFLIFNLLITLSPYFGVMGSIWYWRRLGLV